MKGRVLGLGFLAGAGSGLLGAGFFAVLRNQKFIDDRIAQEKLNCTVWDYMPINMDCNDTNVSKKLTDDAYDHFWSYFLNSLPLTMVPCCATGIFMGLLGEAGYCTSNEDEEAEREQTYSPRQFRARPSEEKTYPPLIDDSKPNYGLSS